MNESFPISALRAKGITGRWIVTNIGVGATGAGNPILSFQDSVPIWSVPIFHRGIKVGGADINAQTGEIMDVVVKIDHSR